MSDVKDAVDRETQALEDAIELEQNPVETLLNTAVTSEEEQPTPLDPGMDIDKDVNHPSHYLQNPAGIEVIDVTEHLNFNVGNAVKYLLRADFKNHRDKDLKKARWYIDRELERIYKYGDL